MSEFSISKAERPDHGRRSGRTTRRVLMVGYMNREAFDKTICDAAT